MSLMVRAKAHLKQVDLVSLQVLKKLRSNGAWVRVFETLQAKVKP